MSSFRFLENRVGSIHKWSSGFDRAASWCLAGESGGMQGG
jgi:hypothetical protein